MENSMLGPINPHEFEGLVSFEEIDSYTVFKEEKKNGKINYRLENITKGKKVKKVSIICFRIIILNDICTYYL